MPAYKLCPRCQLNYILESEDYCSICRDELRGIKVEEEEEDIYTKTCPRCGAPISEDMDYCENCKQELGDKLDSGDENWDGEDEENEDENLENDEEEEEIDDNDIADEEFGDDEEEEEIEEYSGED